MVEYERDSVFAQEAFDFALPGEGHPNGGGGHGTGLELFELFGDPIQFVVFVLDVEAVGDIEEHQKNDVNDHGQAAGELFLGEDAAGEELADPEAAAFPG